MRGRFCAVALTLLAAVPSALGQIAIDVGECDAALVRDTWQENFASRTDWRLATLVDSTEWEKIRQEFGTRAVIYGMPMETEYKYFREQLNKKLETSNEQFSKDEVRSIAWTGLTQLSKSAYSDCLDKIALRSTGLHLLPKKASEDNVTLYILWNPGQFGPDEIDLQWDVPAGVGAELPKRIAKSEKGIPYRLDRPPGGEFKVVGRYVCKNIVCGGNDVLIPRFTKAKPHIDNCVRFASDGTCARCEIQVDFSAQGNNTWALFACGPMPKDESVAMHFNGTLTYFKKSGISCWHEVLFKGPDGTSQRSGDSNYGVQGNTSCGASISSDPPRFSKPLVPGFPETLVQLAYCDNQKGPCSLSGTLSIYSPEGR